MAFCSKCGNRSDGAFCSKCGTRIVNVSADGKITVKRFVTESIDLSDDQNEELEYKNANNVSDPTTDDGNICDKYDNTAETLIIKPSDSEFDKTRIVKPINSVYEKTSSSDNTGSVRDASYSQPHYDRTLKDADIGSGQSEKQRQSTYRQPEKTKYTIDDFDEPSEKNYAKIALIIILVTLVIALVTVGTIFLVKYLGNNSVETQQTQINSKGMSSPEEIAGAVMVNFEKNDMNGIVSLLESNYVSYFVDRYHNGNIEKLIKIMDDSFYTDVVCSFESKIDFENCEWNVDSVDDVTDDVFKKYSDWYKKNFDVKLEQVKKASVIIDSNGNREMLKFHVIMTNDGWYLAENPVKMHY